MLEQSLRLVSAHIAVQAPMSHTSHHIALAGTREKVTCLTSTVTARADGTENLRTRIRVGRRHRNSRIWYLSDDPAISWRGRKEQLNIDQVDLGGLHKHDGDHADEAYTGKAIECGERIEGQTGAGHQALGGDRLAPHSKHRNQLGSEANPLDSLIFLAALYRGGGNIFPKTTLLRESVCSLRIPRV